MRSYSRTGLIWCAVQGAAEHDRLASNTYRRLNLGLAAWAAANLTLLAKGAASQVVTWCTGYTSIKPVTPFLATMELPVTALAGRASVFLALCL